MSAAATDLNSDPHLQQGFAALEREEWDQALTEFAAALTLQPRLPEAFFGRGRAFYHQGEYELAADNFDRALRLGFNSVEVYRHRALCHNSLNMPEELYDDSHQLVLAEPDNAHAYFLRGYACSCLWEDDAALADFNHSIALNPHFATVYRRRGDLWNRLEQLEKAIADYDEGDRLDPNNANEFHSRGHFWQGIEEYDKSLLAFAAAIRAEPEVSRHYRCRSNVLDFLGREDEADADVLKAQEIELGKDPNMIENRMLLYQLTLEHFNEAPLDNIDTTERVFPLRASPDIQVALDSLAEAGITVKHLFATQQHNQAVQNFNQIYQRDRRNPVLSATPKYEDFDIGEEEPIRCLKDAYWLLEANGTRFAVVLDPQRYHRGLRFQVAAVRGAEGAAATQQFFHYLETMIQKSRCYRGKILSLELRETYDGQCQGIMVHKLRHVRREEVILPRATLDLLDRNVLQFVQRRSRLAALGLATKKGLLFYGPPGTGKTHTLHYLAGALQGHTTFLISAEQVCNLPEYMTLARLLQPSMVVIEDVDLIARERTQMRSAGEEVMLNKLLNEMDGLKQDCEILFVLTTNRPESLEDALASRPGRVDQAIEYPLPDAEGRAKLVRLYACGVPVADEVVRAIVQKTNRVSASFIKELMRRAIQFSLEHVDSTETIEMMDVEKSLEELLISGGSLNRKMLGAVAHEG